MPLVDSCEECCRCLGALEIDCENASEDIKCSCPDRCAVAVNQVHRNASGCSKIGACPPGTEPISNHKVPLNNNPRATKEENVDRPPRRRLLPPLKRSSVVDDLQVMFNAPPDLIFDDDDDDTDDYAFHFRRPTPCRCAILKTNAYWSPVVKFVQRQRINEVLFIPYAKKDMDEYFKRYQHRMSAIGVRVDSIHTAVNPVGAVESAAAISVGGGNTFLLLKRMYDAGIVNTIKQRVLSGIPYLGVSAGSNVAAVNICTTNDMPIIQPMKLEAIGLLPFNINVHFENRGNCAESRRKEARVDRLRDYLELYEQAPPIVCIRDGSALFVEGKTLGYVGAAPGKLFQRGDEEPTDIPVGTDLSFLLSNRTTHCTRMCLS